MNTPNFEEKEAELKAQFNSEQSEAAQLEEDIKKLQARHQEKVINMTRLQGAFALLKELKEAAPEPEKAA